MNERKVVGATGDLRKEIGDVLSASAILLERPRTLHDRTAFSEEWSDCICALGLFTVVLDQLRFVVEGVDRTDAAWQEDQNNVLCFGREVGAAGGESLHLGECDSTKASARLPQHFSARKFTGHGQTH